MIKSTSEIFKLFFNKKWSYSLILTLGGLATSQSAYAVDPVKEGVTKQDTTAILLNEVSISAGVAKVSKSPLRLKSVNSDIIQTISAGKTFPELLVNTPGVYATAETGSYGDAKINIRGFKQENISVLLNGTPISGLTSGSMFWNNWLGLTDATATIQVQKGIGGSMLSDNSVGGTINIVTSSPTINPSYQLGYTYIGSGLSKGVASIQSGQLKNGWAFSLLGSYTGGSGWVQMTDVNSYAYMATVSKRMNDKHSFLFTVLGSPEEHEQRSSRLTYDEVEQYGRDYNKNWGYITNPDGSKEAKTLSKNFYHKPYFTLNHFYNSKVGATAKTLSLNSAVYVTVGDGGGYWSESKGQRIAQYQEDGYINWDGVVEDNVNSNQGAQNILSNFLAGHTQVGAKSTLLLDISNKLNLDAGIHYQHYRTWEKEEITDLLGGEYWYEDYASNSLVGVAGRDPIKEVGDYIRTDNGKILNYGTLYSMFTYTSGDLILKLGGSLNGSTHQRWDRYNYLDNGSKRAGEGIYSEIASGLGGAIKTGLLYKLDRSSSFYLNGAFYSRVPYSSVYFASGNNQISEGVKNEKNALGELGYRFIHNRGGVEATFYASYWINKSLMSNPYKPLEEDSYKFMITGLDAFHYGVEVDAWYNFTRFLKATAYASIGDWRWKNNVSANIYDPYSGQVLETIDVYSDGLPVGDAPQTQVGAALEFKPIKSLMVGVNWQHNARYWADFDPATRTDADDSVEPYQIPSYSLVNLTAQWQTNIGKRAKMTIFTNLNNLFNAYYIARGKDGFDHTKESFSGYWGEGRNWNFGVRLSM